MNDQDESPHKLGPSTRDHTVAVARGIVGAIPMAGPILSEIITAVIPQQRLDRLEDYVRRLGAELEAPGNDIDASRLRDSEAVDLFEEGGFQTARAATPERRAQIAKLVAFGISGNDKARIESKRILVLLRSLDDDQILILSSYLTENAFDDEFWERHAGVLRPASAHMGSDQDEIDQEAVSKIARQQLRDLDLIRARYPRLKKGEIPEFDIRTGQMKSNGTDLTSLGRLLLRRIGITKIPA